MCHSSNVLIISPFQVFLLFVVRVFSPTPAAEILQLITSEPHPQHIIPRNCLFTASVLLSEDFIQAALVLLRTQGIRDDGRRFIFIDDNRNRAAG